MLEAPSLHCVLLSITISTHSGVQGASPASSYLLCLQNYE